MRNEEVDPKVYGNPWVDLRWDNLGLIWIIWGCKYGIMQSGAIVIIRATRHAEGASQKAGPPRKLRPPNHTKEMGGLMHYSDPLVCDAHTVRA